MSSVDFEQMSNDELRKQMELYGLPKVPITASTRTLLVKRLQTHANGSANTGKSSAAANKSRRETVHVVKYSSDDDSDRDAAKEKLKKKMENHRNANARRQTIGIPSASPAAPTPRASLIPTPAEKPSRKSMRATPTKTTRESDTTSRHIVQTRTIPVTIEDSDEEIIEVPVKRSVDRRSKSTTPTLAKSDLVTTSYKQVVGTVHEEEPEEEEENDQSDLEEDTPLSRYATTRQYEFNAPKASPIKPMSIRISPLRRTALPSGSFQYEPLNHREGSSSSYSRPSLATTTTSSYSNRYSGASTQHPDDKNPDDFPYLREFSKRLSTLKAEPLHKRQSALTSSATTRTTTTYSTSARTHNYRPVSHWYDPITQMLARLDEKYALKGKILILLAILVVIFVVVMFFY